MLEDCALETTMMKKSAFALSALALASSAALAQSTPSSVTVYGIVDAGVVHTTGLATNKNQLVSGIMEGSRLGFRGNEDIGGGFRAIFTLEQRLELNNGTFSNRPPTGAQVPDRLNQAALLGLPSALQPAVSGVAAQVGQTLGVNIANNPWDRQVYVGLVTPVGAVLAGRQYTPAYEINATFDALGTQSSLAAGQVASIPPSVDIRVSNALQYRIVYGGITAGAMYAFGGNALNSKANRFGGAMAMYKGANFSVGIGYNQRNNDIGQESLKSLVIGANANLGPGTAYVLVGQIEDDNPSGVSTIATNLTPLTGATAGALVQNAFTAALRQDGRLAHVGYKLTTGANTFYVAYSSFNDRRAANADVASYGAAYSYALSKRTDINVVLTHFDNKGLAQAAPGQAGFLGGVTKNAGTDSNSLALGVRHRF
jgi:predicted porin